MLQQHGLHFRRSDSEALVLDHLLHAIDDAVEAVGIDGGHVTGPVPAITKHHTGRFRSVPVTHHELRAAHHQLAVK